jgi:hypothetical protein
LIDVAVARLNGVLPIPFHSNEEFLAYDFSFSEEEEMEDGVYDMENAEETQESYAADESEEVDSDDQESEESSDETSEVVASGEDSVEWEEEETPKQRRRSRNKPTADVEWE